MKRKLHTRKCFARALICAVENKRDEDGMNDWAFWCAASDGVFFNMAHDYYDGLIECICEVMPADRDGIPYCRVCRDWHMGANHIYPDGDLSASKAEPTTESAYVSRMLKNGGRS